MKLIKKNRKIQCPVFYNTKKNGQKRSLLSDKINVRFFNADKTGRKKKRTFNMSYQRFEMSFGF